MKKKRIKGLKRQSKGHGFKQKKERVPTRSFCLMKKKQNSATASLYKKPLRVARGKQLRRNAAVLLNYYYNI